MTDPDRAERIAESTTEEDSKAVALACVAGTVVAVDPDRAARLSDDTERIARSITDVHSEAVALLRIADVWKSGVGAGPSHINVL